MEPVLDSSPLFFPSTATRREVRRYARTDCQVVTERDFRLLGERTLNLSSTGLLLDSHSLVGIGEAVYVAIRIPGGDSWIDASGTVSRVLWKNDDVHALAVQFAPLSLVDSAILEAALQRRPPLLKLEPHILRDYASWISHISH